MLLFEKKIAPQAGILELKNSIGIECWRVFLDKYGKAY